MKRTEHARGCTPMFNVRDLAAVHPLRPTLKTSLPSATSGCMAKWYRCRTMTARYLAATPTVTVRYLAVIARVTVRDLTGTHGVTVRYPPVTPGVAARYLAARTRQ